MNNSLLDRALRDHRSRHSPEDTDLQVLNAPDTDPVADAEAKAPREVGGSTYEAEQSETLQPFDEDNWFTDTEYGIPRGAEAWEAHELGSTAAMEIVKNTIVDQITGGELDFPSEDGEDVPDEVEALKEVFGQVLSGPHLLGDDFDDIVTAAVSDMIDVGDAYWQCLAAENNADTLPVIALKPLDSLTLRLNIDEHGNWREDGPAYYQAPYQSYAGDTIALGNTEPVGLDRDDVVTFRWPGSRRSNRAYPLSPTMQVKQWLELLSNNTTHLNRFYSDNEIPPGLLQVVEGTSDDVDTISAKIEEASGDPRKAPVIGGNGEAKWIEVGGSALNLDIIEEQRWFLQLCWGAVGINKAEVGIVEDVNRNTAEEQSQTIFKRVTLPLTRTFEQAVERQVMRQFDVWRDLEEPFGFSLSHSDPEREAAREQELLERWQAGSIGYSEYRRRLGEDPEDTEVELPNGETFDYGPHPKSVGEILINAHKNAGGSGSDSGGESEPGDPDDPVDDPIGDPVDDGSDDSDGDEDSDE